MTDDFDEEFELADGDLERGLEIEALLSWPVSRDSSCVGCAYFDCQQRTFAGSDLVVEYMCQVHHGIYKRPDADESGAELLASTDLLIAAIQGGERDLALDVGSFMSESAHERDVKHLSIKRDDEPMSLTWFRCGPKAMFFDTEGAPIRAPRKCGFYSLEWEKGSLSSSGYVSHLDAAEQMDWLSARQRAEEAGCYCADTSMCHTCVKQDSFR